MSFNFSNNNSTPTSFGGFSGSSNNTSGPTFGAFGSNNNTTPGAFGGGSTGNTGGFGGSAGAFGQSTNNAFGQNKSPFGSNTNTSSGGLFGNTSNTGSGGFGNTGATSGGSLFGSSSNNAFGSGTSAAAAAGGGGGFTGFGQSNNQPSAFGSPQSKPLFGSGGAGTTGPFSGAGTALGQEVPPSQGTAIVPFEPVTEKEQTGTGSSVYQTITFQQPYQKYALEELRIGDYNAGRRFGTGTGQAGTFGASNFGSSTFGGSNTGAFGSNSNASGTTLFGSNNNSAFGGSGTGGLFGSNNNNNNQNKPGGLFGQQTTSATSGGLFGTSNNSNTGGGLFGANNNSNSNNNTAGGGGGGLFGSNAQKPAGLFGNTSTNTGAGFNFGNTNNQTNTNQSGGLFGSTNTNSNTGGLFGNNANQANTGGGLFGNTNNNNNNSNTASGGLFGNKSTFNTSNTQAQNSGGLFGNTNTGSTGGLFGNNNTAAQNTSTGGLFGNTATANNNSNQSGGLFGNNNQNKPGGLFGNTNSNTGGGLFGNTSSNTNTGGLFGNTNTNNQQNSGGIFSNNNTNTGGGLFANSQNQNKPGGLFGNTSTNNQGSSLFGNTNSNLFGTSQNNLNVPNLQQQEVKHASLLDSNPYGQSSIWTGLPAPTEDNSKPIFTPLTATKKLEESKMKPLTSLRLNQSRYMTPPHRNGYGFSYSAYGSPSSVASTPNGASLGGSLYGGRGWSGGSFGRSFNRSASVQNLRTQFNSDADDIWKTNAFSPTHRNSSGSIKRLTIDRSIRNDLFHRPSAPPALPAPKPTTIDESATMPQQQQVITDGTSEPTRKLTKRVSFENTEKDINLNSTTGALVRTEDAEESESVPAPSVNGATNSSRSLQAVPEDRESHQTSSKSSVMYGKPDPPLGAYYMKPSRQEIAKMSHEQRKSFKGFVVGREGCGYVTFDAAVDLNTIDLDNLYEKIVLIVARSITVYPNKLEKPPVGKGLNVPSTILLFNSWPRSSSTKKFIPETSGPRFERHLRRLQQMENTHFISYDPEKGWWKFTVDHYTRYGLDYDDEDEDMDQSELSLPPSSIKKSADASVMEIDDQDSDRSPDYENDTFAFKKSVPGQFGQQSAFEEDDDLPEDNIDTAEERDDRSEQSVYSEDDVMSEDDQSPSMPGSLPQVSPTLFSPAKSPTKVMQLGTPGKPVLDLNGDWAEQLQRTISPRKQNREVLRNVQNKVLLDKIYSPIKPRAVQHENFRSSIDIMNSMFNHGAEKKTKKALEPEFEFPYSKRSKSFHPDNEDMPEADQKWHSSFKPHFTGSGAVLYQTSTKSKDENWKETAIAGQGQSLVVAGQHTDKKSFDLAAALTMSQVKVISSVPTIKHTSAPFSQIPSQTKGIKGKAYEVYELAHVLFDEYDDEFTLGLTGPQKRLYAHRIRKDRLTQYLEKTILAQQVDKLAALERQNPTAAALSHLTFHDIQGASALLREEKNIHLMLLVLQLDNQDQSFMDDVKHQIDAWRDQKVLSEIHSDIRALYEICAGNVTFSRGKDGPIADRAETFNIGQRYDLHWLQSFALGLFFGKDEKNNAEGFAKIEDAVCCFHERLDHDELPDNGIRGDVRWSLLKIYAWANASSGYEPLTPILPADLVGLATSFDSSDLFTCFNAVSANIPEITVDQTKVDQLAEVFAAEQSAKGDIASAVYALIHLSDPEARKGMIQDLLNRFAANLPGPDTATSDAGIHLWQTLTMDLHIPQSWLFMAKARYAASAANNGGDNISELRFLIAAEAWDQAHECFTKRAAPSFIVDKDWTGLQEMCDLFGEEPVRKVSDWQTGGAVYNDFNQLMTGAIAKDDGQTISSLRRRIVNLGQRYANAQNQNKGKSTSSIQLGQLSSHELEEHVAIKEMANALARLHTTEGVHVGTIQDILEMPVTSDVRARLLMLMPELERQPQQHNKEKNSNNATKSSGPTKARTRANARQTAGQSLSQSRMDLDDDRDEEYGGDVVAEGEEGAKNGMA